MSLFFVKGTVFVLIPLVFLFKKFMLKHWNIACISLFVFIPLMKPRVFFLAKTHINFVAELGESLDVFFWERLCLKVTYCQSC